MNALNGHLLPYGLFRSELKARSRAPSPVIWTWDEVSLGLDRATNVEIDGLGLLALSRTAEISGGEIVPGLSLSVQSLEPGSGTPQHAHAWWHIYIVQSGSGLLSCSDRTPARRIGLGDIIFIPGWCEHRLENDGDAAFVTLNVSNMAQVADLANFLPG